MSDDNFFEEMNPESRVKVEIVSKYFSAWSKVMTSVLDDSKKIGYIDLYAGPGAYKDGTPSIPLRILKKAVKDDDLRGRLFSFFNDLKHADTLRENIEQIEGVEGLEYEPEVRGAEVTFDTAEQVQEWNLPPSVVLLDPFGYTGLSKDLFEVFLSVWGTDLIVFCNYRRINMGLDNESVNEHMNRLFGGKEKTDRVRENVKELSGEERKEIIVENLAEVLKDAGAEWTLNFEFRHPTADRPTHFLFFATGDVTGFKIMQDIISGRSTAETGVDPQYKHQDKLQTKLRIQSDPIEVLVRDICEYFAGRSLTRDSLFKEHQRETDVSSSYQKKHYNKALRRLEEMDYISLSTDREHRREGTYANHVTIHFPED